MCSSFAVDGGELEVTHDLVFHLIARKCLKHAGHVGARSEPFFM